MNISHLTTCLLLIPAGLAGISTGVHEVLIAVDGLPGLMNLLSEISLRIQPWAQGLVCLSAGLTLLIIAAAMAVRGLQS